MVAMHVVLFFLYRNFHFISTKTRSWFCTPLLPYMAPIFSKKGCVTFLYLQTKVLVVQIRQLHKRICILVFVPISVLGMAFLVLLLLCCYLVQAHSSGEGNKPSCPTRFSCSKLGDLGSPFTSQACPRPELLTLSGCDGDAPTIQLEEGGRGYVVEAISQSDIIHINDPVLRQSLSSRSCQYFEDLDVPSINTPFLSFHFVDRSLQMLKCNSTVSFRSNPSHADCSAHGYSVYNIHDQHFSPPHDCSIIRLPAAPKGNTNTSDLYSLLSAEFSLQVDILTDCGLCLHIGGQCEHDHIMRSFHCAKGKHGLSLHLKKIIAISAAGVGLALALLLFVFWGRRSLLFRKTQRESYVNIENFLLAFGSISPRRYSYSEIKRMTDSFKDKLGEGGFGGVYKGKLQEGRPVAVKVLKGSKGNGQDFINEVSSISRTSHVNIVSLLGFCFEGPKRALIYEFMPNGSLEKFIYHQKGSSNINSDRALKFETLFRIAVGIARGLEYLHLGCNTRILHFDIKPHNILLDEEFCPKISDFGLAKVCPRKESVVSMLGARGTAGYIAPEVVYRNLGGVSHKSDVYSYGMMVLEMVGGRRNIECEADGTSQIYFPHWIYDRVVSEEGLGMNEVVDPEEREFARKMVMVSLWCVQTEPPKRPSMSRVVEMLEGKVESLENPPKPF